MSLKPRAVEHILLASPSINIPVHAPSRSAQNCEYNAFSPASSSTTSSLVPALLRAETAPSNARSKKDKIALMFTIGGLMGLAAQMWLSL